MIYRFSVKNIKDMLLNQINSNYFKSIDDEMLITRHMPVALERFEKNAIKNENKYYFRINEKGEKEAFFDPLHTCQWFVFLYYMANTIYKNESVKTEEARVVCDKIYGLSKSISGCDLYYEVEMPEVFSLDHPMGAYIGRAKYGNGFSFTEGCTVGNEGADYPVLGENIKMSAGSKIIGNSIIGDNCVLESGTIVFNQNVPANSVVSGKSPNLVFGE